MSAINVGDSGVRNTVDETGLIKLNWSKHVNRVTKWGAQIHKARENCQRTKLNYTRCERASGARFKGTNSVLKNPIILSAFRIKSYYSLYTPQKRAASANVRRVRTAHAHLTTWITRETYTLNRTRFVGFPCLWNLIAPGELSSKKGLENLGATWNSLSVALLKKEDEHSFLRTSFVNHRKIILSGRLYFYKMIY